MTKMDTIKIAALFVVLVPLSGYCMMSMSDSATDLQNAVEEGKCDEIKPILDQQVDPDGRLKLLQQVGKAIEKRHDEPGVPAVNVTFGTTIDGWANFKVYTSATHHAASSQRSDSKTGEFDDTNLLYAETFMPAFPWTTRQVSCPK